MIIRNIKGLVFSIVFFFFFLPYTAFAAEYHIGPGQTYTTIGGFPWSSALVAGDIVYIHAKDGQIPYYEHLCIGGQLQGTQAAPIKIIGVSDGSGSKPILDGADSTTSTNFNLYGADPQYHSELGLLFFGPGPSYGSAPAWVEVSNLTIRNAKNVSSTNELGVTKTLYMSSVYLQGGVHITLSNMDISGGLDGVFAKDGSSPVEHLTIKNSYIHNNGIVDNHLYHNVYTEVKYLTIENTVFGRPTTGSPGNNVKDRSSGLVFRYNQVVGGAHLLDLVECQDECVDHTSDEAWDDIFVYGNTFYSTHGDATQLFHVGTGDTGANSEYWRKNLYFYNNTVLLNHNQATTYKASFFQITGNQQTVYLNNNIFYTYPVTLGAAIPIVGIQQDNSVALSANGNVSFGVNWITPGYVQSTDGTALGGVITGANNIVSSGSMAFEDISTQNMRLSSGSAAIGIGGVLPAKVASNWTGTDLTPIIDPSGSSRANISDLGAYAYSGGIIPPTKQRYRLGSAPIIQSDD